MGLLHRRTTAVVDKPDQAQAVVRGVRLDCDDRVRRELDVERSSPGYIEDTISLVRECW
jgi:hypothetical protein